MNKQVSIMTEYDRQAIKRVGLGSLASFLGQLISFLGRVITIPLFLHAWGAEKYGEWLTLYAAVGYLTILEFGMQPYIVNRLIQTYSLKRLKDYTRVLHSALAIYLSVALIAMTLVAVLIPIVPFEKWLDLNSVGPFGSRVIILLLAAQIVLAIPMGIIRGLYPTVGEWPRGKMTENFQWLFLYGIIVLVLVASGGLVSMAAVQFIPLGVITLFVLYDLRRRHPEIRLGLKERDWHLAFTFIGPSLLFFLMYIAGALTLQGSTLIVNAFLGSASVAVFATLRTMCNLIRQVVGSLQPPIWPEITSMEAKRDYGRLRAAHRLLVKLSLAISASAAVALHFTGKDVVNLWTQGRITFDQRLLDLFVLYLTTQAIWSASSLFLMATNQHRNLSICRVISSILGLSLAVILAPRMGIKGVVAGLWIAEASLLLWFVPWETCKLIKENVRIFWLDSVVRGFPVMLIQGLAAWQISSVVNTPLSAIVLVCAAVGFVAVTAGYFLWLNVTERAQVMSISLKLWAGVKSVAAHLVASS